MNHGREDCKKLCKRWNTGLDAHCLTFSCFGRQPFLSKPRACHWFADSLCAAKEYQPFDLWAYVLMPEHVHLVLWPGETTCISSLLKSMKLPVTIRCLAWVRQSAPMFLNRMEDRQPNGAVAHRFWQRGGGYDRNLRSDRDIYEKIRYIHNNPVRRGLAERPEDWPWSSAATYATGKQGFIKLDMESLPPAPVS